MMSRKFIEQEGKLWTEQGIITPEQHQQILSLYSDRKHAIGVIPILGSILVGLGILTFIAANWQDIPQLVRLSIIIAAMIGFYITGDRLLAKGHDKLGISIISLGLITFGAGIILVAQMFQLEAYNASSWIIWSLAALLLTYLYRSHYLFFISLLLITITQLQSASHFYSFSTTAYVITVIGMGYYVWKNKDALLTWMLGISFIIQSIIMVSVLEWKFMWVFVPAFIAYTLVDVFKERKYLYPLQTTALIGAYVFAVFIIMFGDEYFYNYMLDEILANTVSFLITISVIFVISLLLKLKNGSAVTAVDWILVPVLLYLPFQTFFIHLILLFVFSLYVLWRGYVEEWRLKINLGIVLFLASTMIAYIKLTWDFMDKSLFFILGGVILLALSWLLNRQRNVFLRDVKEAERND